MAPGGIAQPPAAPLPGAISAEALAVLAQFANALTFAQKTTDEEQIERERQALVAELELGTQARSQIVADRMFPPGPGLQEWLVVLNDKNGQPQLRINARSEFEARACYEQVCGIKGVDPSAGSTYVVQPVPQTASISA